MDLALAGKRAIITGGTGGIGIAIARHLALEGVRPRLALTGGLGTAVYF